MRANGDVEVLADDVDGLVRSMRDDVDLRIADKEIRNHVAHRELRRGDSRGEPHRSQRFREALAHRGLGLFGLLQHRDGVPTKLAARFGHSEASRRPIEEPYAKIRLQLLHAMAQR